jgi:hypothetical protein
MSDIVTSRIFVDGEKGITAAKLNDIVASSVIQPAFYTSKPTASTADPTDVMLLLKSGAYAQVPVSTLANSISNSQIWSTRLRSFNAIGNPNFEMDQRNIGNVVAAPATGTLIQDRWAIQKAGTLVASSGRQTAAASEVLVPGTNFAISRNFHRLTMTTAQASLGASDNLMLFTQIEGPQFRELQYDVHSISLLVRTSVAGLNFGLSVQDPATTTKSLVKLCTVPASNTWTLIALPNLPVFPSGNFSTVPGVLGYLLGICLAAGATMIAPANDTWQNGNFIGAVGQSNFAAGSASTFDIAFVQHEPGPVCSTFIDKPFSANYDECLQHFQKSYDYATIPGTVTNNGIVMGPVFAGNPPQLWTPFKKRMSKVPSVFAYSPSTGAGNNVRDGTAGIDRATSSPWFPGENGFSGFGTASTNAANAIYNFHWVAGTGW